VFGEVSSRQGGSTLHAAARTNRAGAWAGTSEGSKCLTDKLLSSTWAIRICVVA